MAAAVTLAASGHAQIENPGFESNWSGWNDTDPSAISGVAHSGSRAAKITGSGGRFEQTLNLSPNTTYTLSVWIDGRGTFGIVGGVSRTVDNSDYEQETLTFTTGSSGSVTIYGAYGGSGDVRFDDFAIETASSGGSSGGGGSSSGGSSGGTPVQITPTVLSQPASTQSSNAATNMFDGDFSNNTGARWSASGLQSGSLSVKLDLGAEYDLTEIKLYPYKNRAYQYAIKRSDTGSSPWTDVVNRRNNTQGGTVLVDSAAGHTTRYLELLVTGASGYTGNWASIIELEIFGTPTSGGGSSGGGSSGGGSSGGGSSGGGSSGTLDPNKAPGENFDLGQWKITFPDASEKDVAWLIAGGERANEFYTGSDGAMVFRCPNHGSTTSSSTKYSRTELREMLRGTDTSISTKGLNKNNWVFSSSSASNQAKAGGVDGTLRARLAVNHVSTTYDSGNEYMVGRVIVGQIHAPDDEPCKLYYRKLPGNSKGSVYFAYEVPGGNDIIYPLIGSPDSNAADPADGIALNEKWNYEIKVVGRQLTVTVTRDNGQTYSKTITMGSGYDDQWMYFKAGAYNQNNGGSESDYVQVSFYELTHTHP
ncbi:MAG: cyclic nucleotide-binding protein [Verrucomicrobia bacterium]|nr:MAG: cyclic nucleotide-binding protein [Verrucomicrobiota bacterium]